MYTGYVPDTTCMQLAIHILAMKASIARYCTCTCIHVHVYSMLCKRYIHVLVNMHTQHVSSLELERHNVRSESTSRAMERSLSCLWSYGSMEDEGKLVRTKVVDRKCMQMYIPASICGGPVDSSLCSLLVVSPTQTCSVPVEW